MTKWEIPECLPHRADSSFAPSQWEMVLLCNDVSHWLGASLESALSHVPIPRKKYGVLKRHGISKPWSCGCEIMQDPAILNKGFYSYNSFWKRAHCSNILDQWSKSNHSNTRCVYIFYPNAKPDFDDKSSCKQFSQCKIYVTIIQWHCVHGQDYDIQ